MGIELAIILILGFVIIYILLIRIFSTLLRLTGLTSSKAKFQAISLITNTGFTTAEAEIVTTSRARRNIARAAMISGHVFSVIIVSLIFNFINVFSINELKSNYLNIILVFASFILLFLIFKIPFIEKLFEKMLERLALKLIGKLKNENLIVLLDNYGKESIVEVTINELPSFIENKSLKDLNLRELYNLNILSLRRKGKSLEVCKNTTIEIGDILIVYGFSQSITNLFIKKINYSEIKEIKKETKE